jgi:hypothetical protein
VENEKELKALLLDTSNPEETFVAAQGMGTHNTTWLTQDFAYV